MKYTVKMICFILLQPHLIGSVVLNANLSIPTVEQKQLEIRCSTGVFFKHFMLDFINYTENNPCIFYIFISFDSFNK